jgi:formylmethanofuran dehydrogenase subunit E
MSMPGRNLVSSCGIALGLAFASGCAGNSVATQNVTQATTAHHHPALAAEPSDVDARLAEVARAHGGAGPWAVSGYRMGSHALTALGLTRGSFDLEITHYTPHEVQYACIADGASAATGASVGKLNLTLAEATEPETRTLYRRKSTGQSITLRVTKAFAARFVNVPREKLGEAGREAMQLPDADVFELVP